MTDITFVTSNLSKLAHARYLCRNYQVNILHYKKFFYGVGYEEPRIYDRKQLLAESFKDAVARWKRNVTERDNRLFFIEDTSVKIDALSEGDNEVPGVDVKYWMRETDFNLLDQELKNKGNNRKCSVTSHVMLFLTEDLQKKLGITEDYKIFKSTAYGEITEKEYSFETQILYPWLDNKTFNKWFVPNGYSLPVSLLDISQTDTGDFRKGAFEQMLTFLEENGAIKNKRRFGNQLHLQFYDSFVVCGRTCAGKSTIGKFLVDEYGYYHIEASEFMTHKLLETHGSKSNIDKHLFASKVLKVEPLFVVNKLIDFLHEHEIYDKFVITGFRTKDEVDAFFKAVYDNMLHLVYINSNFEERFKRWRLRRREVDSYSENRFREIDTIQDGMGVGEIESILGVKTIDNNTDGLMRFFRSFRKKFLDESNRDAIRLNKKELKTIKISLEKAILITLAIEYQKDESSTFTTTEISHMINRNFKVLERSKNNVSRYFNQSYNVYYEVKYENKKNRYKISPIGYSEAMTIIRNLKHYRVDEV